MKVSAIVSIRVEAESRRALRALRYAAQRLAEDDFPYREEPKQAAKALRYAAKHLTVRSAK